MIEISTARLRRIAALGLLAGGALLLVLAVLLPLAGALRSAVDERELLLKEDAKLQGLVDAAPEMKRVLATVAQHPVWQRVYRDASSSAAASSLQKDFRALAEAQSISVDTLQPLDAAGEGDFTHIGLRVGFSTQIDHLGQLLAAMQAAPHFMRFENLSVTSPMSAAASGNATLVVRGDIQAYCLAGEQP